MSVRRYELAFPAASGTGEDIVVVDRTDASGPGGHPVYADASGIVRAEISDRGEVRMMPSGGHQVPEQPVAARPLPDR
ncbi:DUF6296 family protein [Streptomyces sp. NPDC059564]|uniref:DUF6296 family protein n=1 Tax=Streptomyces sp. NPDC059564 TaxID=3346865 RepID=UPI0036B77F99